MIVVARYPVDTYPAPENPLDFLRTDMARWAPGSVVLHLLPFWRSSGDGGFAIDDWEEIDPALGDWSAFERLATARRLLVDAVLNHVGRGHELVQRFIADPERHRGALHAYDKPIASAPFSPRGGRVLKPLETTSGTWYVWCSFTDAAVDLNLASKVVRSKIIRFLRLLRAHQVWGVRLDAVAYYKKDIGRPLRHLPGVHELAGEIADDVKRAGLRVFAQVDADPLGRKYFQEERHKDIGLFDFAFPILILLALYRREPRRLADHLIEIDALNRRIVRSPRTHDGILLRSESLADVLPDIVAMAAHIKLPVRLEQGQPYELNGTLPAILRLLNPADADSVIRRTLRMVMFVTAMSSDDAYFYGPSILDHVNADPAPKESTNCMMRAGITTASLDDPRQPNRAAAPRAWHHNFVKEDGPLLCQALDLMTQIQEDSAIRDYGVDGPLLWLYRGRWCGVFNFGVEAVLIPRGMKNGRVRMSESVNATSIHAHGYLIVNLPEENSNARANH